MKYKILRRAAQGLILAGSLVSALAFAQSAPLHKMGALPPRQTILPAPRAASTQSLPASVDLSQWAVPVGDQGNVNSCISWAIGYGMAGWYAKNANMGLTAFAPMYMYSQINVGKPYYDEGAYPSDGFALLAIQGIDLASDYPQTILSPYSWPYYPFYDWQDPPTAAQQANAAPYKIGEWHILFAVSGAGTAGQQAIQDALANGQPVAIEFPVRPGFDNLSAATNYIDNDTTGAIRGNHEVLAVGYDQNGILIQNSWGTGWGKAGFGYLSWAVVQNDVMEADVIDQAFYNTTTYTVTASAGTGGTISPSGSVAVASGTTRTFTLTPNTGYQVSSVSGTCGGTLSGNSYTTKAITANCTVTASFIAATYTVTASAGTGGTINPAGSVLVSYGTTKTYTITPNSGYAISSIGGTCGGTLSGNTFTTRAITSACTVVANFVASVTYYNVTASAGTGGTINPSGSAAVPAGATKVFGVSPNANYKVSSVGGTCGGTLIDNMYWTKPVSANCTVTATFTYSPTYYTVTASAGTGGAISPVGALSTLWNATRVFTITPNTGYAISSVGGTCGGKLSGNIYTTNAITANCTVTAAFTPLLAYYNVTLSSGTGGTINPSGNISVAKNGTLEVLAYPNLGYRLDGINGCGENNVGAYSMGGAVYSYYRGPITANCSVTATFAPTPIYTITPSVSGTGGTISYLQNVSNSQVTSSGNVLTNAYNIVSFKFQPDSGYKLASVGGTCGGQIAVNTSYTWYITNFITGNCTVIATFAHQ